MVVVYFSIPFEDWQGSSTIHNCNLVKVITGELSNFHYQAEYFICQFSLIVNDLIKN